MVTVPPAPSTNSVTPLATAVAIKSQAMPASTNDLTRRLATVPPPISSAFNCLVL